MPNRLRVYLVSFLFGAIFMNACTEKDNSQLVNRDYLQSEGYKKFEKEFRNEASRKENQDRSLKAHLQELDSCKNEKSNSLPVRLNREELSGLLERSSEKCRQVVTSKSLGFDVHLVAETRLENHSLKWVLLKNESVYVNWQLLAVIFQDNQLVSFKKVGVFQKNLSKDIDTEIEVYKADNNLMIKAEITRKIIYPFEQSNSSVMQYKINSKGVIQNIRKGVF